MTGKAFDSSAKSSDEARLDVNARGFLQRGQRASLYVRVFNPFAKGHQNQKLDTAFTSNENEKKLHYNQRVIEVEHGSFSPLVSASYWGSGREAEQFLAQLALKLSEKKRLEYSNVTNWLRAKLSFNLSGSALLVYVRGLNSFLFYMGIIFTSQAVFCVP